MKGAKNWATAVVLGLSLTSVSPRNAQACGGFFCSRTPVDQTAERIIFAVNDDHTVTAHVQITYAGDKDNFAWIVPVPGEVDPGQFPQRALTALDVATEPSYQTNSCLYYRDFAGAGGPTAAPVPLLAANESVTVLQEQTFGPFASATIIGDDAATLVAWLQDSGYRITDSMVPYIAKYVDDGMAFFAMKLLPEADVSDISPVSITYAGDEPMIPIRLTTVASEPEMGIVTWVLSDTKFAPKNYVDLKISDDLIEFDPSSYGSVNNYLTVVSKEVDRAGGHAMVTEYAASTEPLLDAVRASPLPPPMDKEPDPQAALVELLSAHKYITRLYTRMSAEEMTVDPYFTPASNAGDVDRVHNLSCKEGSSISCDCPDGSVGVRNCGAPDFGWYAGCECGSPDDAMSSMGGAGGASASDAGVAPIVVDTCGVKPPSPCAFTYCGRSGSCLPNDALLPVCVCDTGATARARTTTAGALQLYCEPLTFNFMTDPAVELSDPDAGVGFANACDGYDCGDHGACTLMNGSPTCQCEQGYGATVKSVSVDGATRAQISCEAVQGIVPALPILPEIGETTVADGMMPRLPGEGASDPVVSGMDGQTTPPDATGTGTTPGMPAMGSVSNDGVDVSSTTSAGSAMGVSPAEMGTSASSAVGATDQSGAGCAIVGVDDNKRSPLAWLAVGLGLTLVRRRRRTL